MSDEEFENVLRLIVKEKDAGMPYKDILASLQGVWLSTGIPKTTRSLQSFIQSAKDSKRSPQWYKQWHMDNMAKNPKKAKRQVKKMLKQLQNSDAQNPAIKKKSLEEVKEDLIGILSSCQFLASVGAIDSDGAIQMIKDYLIRLD